jgi:hypothetical protein
VSVPGVKVAVKADAACRLRPNGFGECIAEVTFDPSQQRRTAQQGKH